MFSRIKYRIRVLVSLAPYAMHVKRLLVILLILGCLSTALSFVTPIFYKIFIDEVVLKGLMSKICVVAFGYFGVFFVEVVIKYIKNWATYTLVNTTMFNVRLKILKNYFNLPFSEYETASIGDMKLRIDDDTNQILSFAGNQTIDYLFSYITLLVSVGILFLISWQLAIFSMVAIPLTFWLDHLISRRENVINNVKRQNDEEMSAWLHASIQGWREIKALNLSRYQIINFYHFLHIKMLYFARWINLWTARVLVIPQIKNEFFMRFGLYFIGGFLIIWGKLKISNLLVFAMYYEMLSNAVKTVSSTDADLQSNMPFTDRLMESLQEPINNNSIRGVIPDESNTITIKNVSFAYPNSDCNVLNNFSIDIRKGDRVAIIGRSGCGKSTLLKLITGLITPTSGYVLFSGINLRDVNLSAMHSRFGFVMQENSMFNTTIRENLLYGNQDSTDTEILEACQKACILEFINDLKDGLDTVIGEKGIRLSGGQRQRLILARLFLRNVEIFIFDEATSALDQYSENIVHDAIRCIENDKTIIVVSHRESSISLCDRKIRMGG